MWKHLNRNNIILPHQHGFGSGFLVKCNLWRQCMTGLPQYINVTKLLLAYVSQISRPVEASQALVSSSRLTIPSLPDGGRCCGQTSNMWSTVCSGAPHSQTEESLRPHFSMDELNRPTPVRRRLRVVHCFRGKSRPGTLCGSRMKLCSLQGGAASQSSFQRVLGAPNR